MDVNAMNVSTGLVPTRSPSSWSSRTRIASVDTARQSIMNVFFHGSLPGMDYVEQIPEAIEAGLITFKILMPCLRRHQCRTN
jgi:hypothetical protein